MEDRSLIVARCVNAASSDNRLLNGEHYAIFFKDLYYHVVYVGVYQIPDAFFGLGLEGSNVEEFVQSEDKLWRTHPDRIFQEELYLGEFSISRFEILHTKPEILSALHTVRERTAFTSGAYREKK